MKLTDTQAAGLTMRELIEALDQIDDAAVREAAKRLSRHYQTAVTRDIDRLTVHRRRFT